MQSSPPQRAWDRNNPPSPTNSQYSLDLGALGLDSHSNDSSPLPKPRVDRVFSEDIDGPSDFTLNMEKWMHGGTVGRGTVRGARGALQSLREERQHQMVGDESVRRRKPEGDLEVPNSPVQMDDEPTQSHHTPDHSPPKDSPWHERPLDFGDEDGQEDEAEQPSSDWNPYASNGTPTPPQHRQLLQPTVEDYQSELTPARPTPARVPSLQVMTNSAPPPQQQPQSPHQSEPSTPGRPSSDTLSPIRSPTRSPVMQRNSHSAPPAEVSSPFTEPPTTAGREVQSQLQALQARCQQLESLNSALKQALDEEQRIRRAEKAAHERMMETARQRERDLTDANQEAHSHADAMRHQSEEQSIRVRELEAASEVRRKDASDEAQRWQEAMQKLKHEHEASATQHEDEAQQLKRDLELAKRGKEAAEETARVHREELQNLRDSEDAELERLRKDAHSSAAIRARSADLEAQVKAVQAESEALRNEKAAAERNTATVRTELETLKSTHDDATVKVAADHQTALESAERLQSQLKDRQRELQNEQMSHDEEIERLQASHEAMLAALKADHDVEKDEHEAQQSILNDAILERDAAQDNLQTLQTDLDNVRHEFEAARADLSAARADNESANTELAALREQLKDTETVNAALDARVADALRKREVYWRGRLEESEKERKVIAKALMRQWGREEVGVMEPEQAYLYKYLKSGRKAVT